MKQVKESKLETYFSYIVVALSLIVGSFGCFWLYIRKYLKTDETVRIKIEDLMNEMSVVANKHTIYLFIVSCIAMLLLWIIGFIIYKIIFKIAKVSVKDVELLIALGTAYTVSFFTGYFIIGKIPLVAVIIITNLIEMGIIYVGLFDKVKEKIGLCIVMRGIILGLNVAITIVS